MKMNNRCYIFPVILLFSVAMALTGCRKCTDCTVKIKATSAIDTVLPESCGSESDIEDFENAAMALFPDSVYEVNCLRYDGKR